VTLKGGRTDGRSEKAAGLSSLVRRTRSLATVGPTCRGSDQSITHSVC